MSTPRINAVLNRFSLPIAPRSKNNPKNNPIIDLLIRDFMAKRSSSNFSNPRKRIPSISFGVFIVFHLLFK